MSSKVNYSDKQVLTADLAKALSHPTRVFIMQKLSKMNSCCYSGDIAEELNIGRSALSLHLKELKLAGLINGTNEPPYIKYCINRENWEIAKQLFKNLFEE
jgi:DNA-binding transcriptional ArsR family regulator